MYINFLFYNFTNGHPNYNIVPIFKAKNFESAPAANYDFFYNPTIERTLTVNNDIISDYCVRFVKTTDQNIDNILTEDAAKNIYYIQTRPDDLESAWPILYLTNKIVSLINNNLLTLVIGTPFSYPVTTNQSAFEKNLRYACARVGIFNWSNIVIIIDAAEVLINSHRALLSNEFLPGAEYQHAYIPPEYTCQPGVGAPKIVGSKMWERFMLPHLYPINGNYLESYLQSSTFSFYAANETPHQLYNEDEINSTLSNTHQHFNKPFSFLYLNHNLRSHRYFTYKCIEMLGILDSALYSFKKPTSWNEYQSDSIGRQLLASNSEDNQTLLQYIVANPDINSKDLPNDDKFESLYKDNLVTAAAFIDSKNLRDTYFSVVTETGGLSEKTYKLFFYTHPFIIIGAKGLLKELHELGYKTFDMLFDESYDDMNLGIDKIVFICNQIKRYCGDSGKAEFIAKMPQIVEVLKYNRKLFLEKDHNKFWASI